MLSLLEHRYVRQVRRYWLTIAFVLGFCTDVILLNRIDDVFDNSVLAFYAIVATLSFLTLYMATAEKFPERISQFLKTNAPIVMQYAFGGLLSGMLIFYGRSGDWLTSSPFLLLIVLVIFGNEFIKKSSNLLIYHLILYYIGMYAYVVLVVPVLLGRMGDLIFILSGIIALGIVIAVVRALYNIVPNFMNANTKHVIVTIGFIYIGFNALYFTNVIPPIPLSLTELTVAHDVSRTQSGSYRIVEEQQLWYRAFTPLQEVVHPSRGVVSCFARVYAPTRLTTDIYHQWQYKNAEGDWVDRFRLSYPVLHTNQRGYRGYTTISNYQSGEWRCRVETERGQVLGQQRFLIDTTEPTGPLVTRIE